MAKRSSKSKTKASKSKGALVSRATRPPTKGGGSVTVTDPMLQAYMREVTKYPLLSPEEEKELAIEFVKTGSREAFQRLVTHNLRFVVKIAYEYVNYRMKLLDLIQEGNTGLVKAVQEFDPYKGVRLTTYAVWWIRSYIQDYILKNYSLVKMGTTQAQKKLFYRLRREQAELERQGIAPGRQVKLLASKLDVSEKDVVDMDRRMSGGDLSLNAPTNSNEEVSHIQRLADESESAENSLAESEQRQVFKDLLLKFGETLEGRDRYFFEKRLMSDKPVTLQELGNKYGVSKERARQIEEKIKNNLKKYMQTHYPDFNLLVD